MSKELRSSILGLAPDYKDFNYEYADRSYAYKSGFYDAQCLAAELALSHIAGAAKGGNTSDNITQAAANKAAEEGGLPVLPQSQKTLLCFNSKETPAYSHQEAGAPYFEVGQMHDYALQAIAADRASRQVANKAEVEEKLGDYWMDKGFLQWVHDRLRFVHKENENIDYMHKLRSIIASFPDDSKTPNVASIATPPATTGASTVLTDERTAALVEARDAVGEFRKNIDIFSESKQDAALAALDGALHAIDALIGEVAAQAGQVAVPGWISTDDRLPENGKDVIILYWPYNNHENERVAGTAHHVEGTFYDEDGNDMHPPSHWMTFVIPEAAPSPAKESK